MAKQLIPRIEQLSRESKELFEVLNGENDLSAILVAASFLDVCLASILERKLIDSKVTKKLLAARGGVLGSFAVRADVCYAIGLLEKGLYRDLLKIAEIRNLIAHHHLALSFKADDIVKLCGELSWGESLGLYELMNTPRNQFVLTAVMISQRLLLIGLGIKRDGQTV
jgi:DNA-binding MltR family transcriptional regulator